MAPAQLLPGPRRRRLRALADARGWSWEARDDDWARREGVPFLPRGRATSVVTGSWCGSGLAAFDLTTPVRAVAPSGAPVPVLLRYWVLLVALPGHVPALELRPGLAGRLRGALLPGRRLVLERPGLGRRYDLRAQDAAAAVELLSPRAVAVLRERPPVALRLAGREAVAWAPGRLTDDRLVRTLDTVVALVDSVPAGAWGDGER